MKLFIVAALITVCAAGRLEHLERAYLPPHQGSAGQFGSQGPSTFGSSFGGSLGSNGFRSTGSLGGHGFGSSGSFDSNGIGASAGLRGSGSFGSSAFPGATINQYLPPDHGPSGASGSHFGSSQGFGSGNQRSQYSQFGSASQYSPSSQYGAPSTFGSNFGSQGQFNSQFPATSRQYLAPKASSSYPQQPFDEETGYHY